jgi:ribosomal protein S20
MNFINISSFKKAQIVLRINAFLLFLFIIATPHFIKEGVWGMPEAAVEGIFLAVEIGVLIRLFKSYDFHSNKSDRKVSRLSGELAEQKELSVDTLKYLGKMNVQMSFVKQLVKKFKAPAERERLKYTINEMLQVIAGLIDNEKVSLRIIDLDSYKTINEVSLAGKNEIGKTVKNMSNENLCKRAQKKNINNLHIISSEHDNFSLKTFVFVENPEGESSYKIDDEQFELAQDIVNQCEMMYLLFKSEYHK